MNKLEDILDKLGLYLLDNSLAVEIKVKSNKHTLLIKDEVCKHFGIEYHK